MQQNKYQPRLYGAFLYATTMLDQLRTINL